MRHWSAQIYDKFICQLSKYFPFGDNGGELCIGI